MSNHKPTLSALDMGMTAEDLAIIEALPAPFLRSYIEADVVDFVQHRWAMRRSATNPGLSPAQRVALATEDYDNLI